MVGDGPGRMSSESPLLAEGAGAEVELTVAPWTALREDGGDPRAGDAAGDEVERDGAFPFVATGRLGARTPFCGGEGGAEAIRNRFRMGLYYLVYCCFCLALTGLLGAATLWEGMAPRVEARLWKRRLRPWEEAAEVFIGTALCMETLLALRFRSRVRGRRFWDCWRVADACVAALTLLCAVFFLFRRVVHQVGEVVEDIDVPILGIRFALQPLRMVATATKVVRVHRLRARAEQEPATKAPVYDPRVPGGWAQRSVLTPAVTSQIREHLPTYLRFAEWRLAYSPREHGTSMNTFYRQQVGPNVLVVRDSSGALFGGFVSEPWRPQAGNYGTGEAFVFVAEAPSAETHVFASASPCDGVAVDGTDAGNVCGSFRPEAAEAACMAPTPALPPLSRVGLGGSAGADAEMEPCVEAFFAMPIRGRVIQWSDSKMLGIGHAIVVFDDFLRGSLRADETFPGWRVDADAGGRDFVVRDFECWHVGGGGD